MKNVTIERLDHEGRGIAKVDGIITFIPKTLVSEVVDIDICKKKKNYNEANAIRLIVKSKDRVDPLCPYFKYCGGCDLMHMKYGDTLKFKKNKVEEIMEKFYKKIPIDEVIENENNFYYRNKVTFQVNNKIGYYEKNSNNIIKIDKCYIADEKINIILAHINKKIDLINITKITIRVSQYNDDSIVIFEVNQRFNYIDIIESLKEYVKSIVIKYKNEFKVIFGKGFIIENVNNFKYKVSHDSFFQVSTSQMIKLYNIILNYCNLNEFDRVLDLYCGAGTIGIYLASRCKKVLGIECNKYAIEDANYNAKLNNIENISFIHGDVSKIISSIDNNYDVVVVDPPRSGLDLKIISFLLKLKCKKIIYVSCNPITLARDLKLLDDDYSCLKMTLVDIFSYTHHVECVCVLKLK